MEQATDAGKFEKRRKEGEGKGSESDSNCRLTDSYLAAVSETLTSIVTLATLASPNACCGHTIFVVHVCTHTHFCAKVCAFSMGKTKQKTTGQQLASNSNSSALPNTSYLSAVLAGKANLRKMMKDLQNQEVPVCWFEEEALSTAEIN